MEIGHILYSVYNYIVVILFITSNEPLTITTVALSVILLLFILLKPVLAFLK